MRQLFGKALIALVLCFLSICFAAAVSAEELVDFTQDQRGERSSGHALSKFLARSNSVENLPDVTNKQLRNKALRDAARKFLGDRHESLESDSYLLRDTDAGSPWHQGWYTRITDKDGTSIAVIGATQYLPSSSIPQDTYLPGYLAVIVRDQNQTKIYESFPEKTFFTNNRNLVLDDPTSSSWEEFSWHSTENGVITSTITNTSIAVMIPGGIEVHADLGPRLPYNATIPWLGPEGLVEFLPIIPLHWFVSSLGSQASYTYTMLDVQGTKVESSGYAHQESNWGTTFPPAWIWSEGINATNSRQFALSGGELTINGTALTTWLVAYHSPIIQWQFRPTLPGTEYITSIDACSGTFSITAKDLLRKLVINATAQPDTFIDVSVPKENDFSPGAVESFAAAVTVKGYIKLPWLGDVLVDRYQFTNAALEFGAGYMCSER
jgi:hypothetical protein